MMLQYQICDDSPQHPCDSQLLNAFTGGMGSGGMGGGGMGSGGMGGGGMGGGGMGGGMGGGGMDHSVMRGGN